MTSVDRIQGLSGGIAIKVPCRVATTANITLSGEQTIDGIAVVDGDRVLVKDQTTGANNGIYEASTAGWSRAPDFDGSNDVVQGTQVAVNLGTTNADTVWRVTTSDDIVIGTTSITLGAALTGAQGPAGPTGPTGPAGGLAPADIGVTVQGYDVDTAKLDVDQTWTGSQRGTVTTDNDGSFDMNVTNNFKCTTAGALALTFTNITAGQSGNILFINGGNHAITAAATTKVVSGTLAAISVTGTYLLGYFSDGTNVYVAATGAMT